MSGNVDQYFVIAHALKGPFIGADDLLDEVKGIGLGVIAFEGNCRHLRSFSL